LIFSFKKETRDDKNFFKTQLKWTPEQGVAKKIPTWASDIDRIKKLHAFFSGAQISKAFRPLKLTAAKVKMGLQHLDELEKKYSQYLPPKKA